MNGTMDHQINSNNEDNIVVDRDNGGDDDNNIHIIGRSLTFLTRRRRRQIRGRRPLSRTIVEQQQQRNRDQDDQQEVESNDVNGVSFSTTLHHDSAQPQDAAEENEDREEQDDDVGDGDGEDESGNHLVDDENGINRDSIALASLPSSALQRHRQRQRQRHHHVVLFVDNWVYDLLQPISLQWRTLAGHGVMTRNNNRRRRRHHLYLFENFPVIQDVFNLLWTTLCEPIFDTDLALIEFTVGLLMIERMLARLAQSVVTIIVVSQQHQYQYEQYQQHHQSQMLNIVQTHHTPQHHDGAFDHNHVARGGARAVSLLVSKLVNFATRLHFGRHLIHEGPDGEDMNSENNINMNVGWLHDKDDHDSSRSSSNNDNIGGQQQLDHQQLLQQHTGSIILGFMIIACAANTAYFHSLMAPLYGRIMRSVQQRRRQDRDDRRRRQFQVHEIAHSQSSSSPLLSEPESLSPSSQSDQVMSSQRSSVRIQNISSSSNDNNNSSTSNDSGAMASTVGVADSIMTDDDRNHEYNTEVLLCFLLVVLFVLEALMVLSVMVVGCSALVVQKQYHQSQENNAEDDALYDDHRHRQHVQHNPLQQFNFLNRSELKLFRQENVLANLSNEGIGSADGNHSVVIMGDLVVVFGIIWTMCVLSSTLVRVGLYQLLGGE